MKICVCSDSHGNCRGLQQMLDREKPQLVLFLGDGERDWSRVELPFGANFAAVCGNCDWMGQEPSFRVMEFYGKRVFLTHGHLYQAKQGLWALEEQARQREAQLVLYGHTHRQRLDRREGFSLLCPGSMSVGSERYALLQMEEGREPEITLCQLGE